jgi:hypothetical protein
MADKAILTLLKVNVGAPIKATNEGIVKVNTKVEMWEVSASLFFFFLLSLPGGLNHHTASGAAAEADA